MSLDALTWYAGKRVFVTGHTGFKGAWLSLWLQQLGAEVTGYALAPEARSLFGDAGVASGMTSVIGDVGDRQALDRALVAAAPDVVIHMAAQSLVRRSYDAPVETFTTNVVGTANLLDAARALGGCRSIVVVTSDKCYENDGADTPFAETAPMGGHDPYSASKGCTELVAAAFARSFFADGDCVVATARAGNVIGGGDWAVDRIIPDLMRAAAAGDRVHIRRPNAVRPWQHVLEPLYGYLLLGQRAATAGREFAGAWNFGPRDADAVAVRTIVAKVRELWPRVAVELATTVEGPHEAALLRLDCAKARARLGWRPVLDLDTALAMTVGWYRDALAAPAHAGALAIDQISVYQNALDELREDPNR